MPRRRFSKLSLRGLLIAVTIIAVLLGAATSRWRRNARAIASFPWSTKVVYHHQQHSNWWTQFLSDWLPVAAFGEITEVAFHHRTPQAAIDSMNRLPSLQRLQLSLGHDDLDVTDLCRCERMKEVLLTFQGTTIPNIRGMEQIPCVVVAQASSKQSDDLVGKSWLPELDRFYWHRKYESNESDVLISTATLTAIGEMTDLQKLEIVCDTVHRLDEYTPIDRKAWRSAFERKPSLVFLELRVPMEDEWIAELPTIPTLEYFGIKSRHLTLDGVAKMNPQPRLTWLSVSNQRLKEPAGTLPIDLSKIAPRLSRLGLQLPLSEDQLEVLKIPTSLYVCLLHVDDLTGANLQAFSGCSKLAFLTFQSQFRKYDSKPRSRFDLQSLPQLPNLVSLEICKRGLRCSDLRTIATKCQSLRMLDLSDCQLEANATQELSDLKSLEWLELRESNVRDEVVSWAGQMPNLRYVGEYRTNVTPEGRNALRRLLTARKQADMRLRVDESILSSPLLRTKDGKSPVIRK